MREHGEFSRHGNIGTRTQKGRDGTQVRGRRNTETEGTRHKKAGTGTGAKLRRCSSRGNTARRQIRERRLRLHHLTREQTVHGSNAPKVCVFSVSILIYVVKTTEFDLQISKTPPPRTVCSARRVNPPPSIRRTTESHKLRRVAYVLTNPRRTCGKQCSSRIPLRASGKRRNLHNSCGGERCG